MALRHSEYENLMEDASGMQAHDLVEAVFSGHTTTMTICLDCSHDSSRDDKYKVLELGVGPNTTTVNEALEGYMTADLCGNDQFQCETCAGKVDAIRSTRLQSPLPLSLILLLKRPHVALEVRNPKSSYCMDRFSTGLKNDTVWAQAVLAI